MTMSAKKAGADIMVSHEDRILWERVVRTTVPLKGKSFADFLEQEQEPLQTILMAELDTQAKSPVPRTAKPNSPTHPVKLDLPTHRKISKGKLDLGGRIDLHGLTQGEAHTLLHAFLHRAHADGLRHVLIITGKGSSLGSDGVLRTAVPHWFATPQFRPLVSAYEDAARHHGGGGALYVRLRRHNEQRRK
jgi:DNA-nicking Smr family endonuclease